MAAQRQYDYEPDQPPLQVIRPGDEPAPGLEESPQAFTRGLLWGLVISALGFWAPVGTALWRWLR
jgi:hypothetical protein